MQALIIAALYAMAAFADAKQQFQTSNVELLAHLDLSVLGASKGNDCWGYVSPSGREYALMGCNNRLAIVEVTDPRNPIYFASIPHTSSTWSDVKVYKDHCYVVTEASGTGIQVVDLSDIDNHVVTLVQTINTPSRSHNVMIDTVSGFLYTVGSNGGTGTTTCWDLSNPSNPVQVGQQSMTPVYQHDVMTKTYPDGRQILFGSGEGRGVEIWDVTDKNNVWLVKRIAYPMVGYCHQSWLSDDGNYLYVNDEFDEFRNDIPTRTLVFDVSDLDNARLVSTFTSGLPSIDHNLYVRNDFIFESNYTSGLRIFDANYDPENPIEVGWIDTHPESNSASFNGTWSNYPFFPSGTIIISDINRGLFIVNADAALARSVLPTSMDADPGTRLRGSLPDLYEDDGSTVTIVGVGAWVRRVERHDLTIEGTSPWSDPGRLRFRLATEGIETNVERRIELYDFIAEDWVLVHSSQMSESPELVEETIQDAVRFVGAGNKLRARVSFKASFARFGRGQSVQVDEATWVALP